VTEIDPSRHVDQPSRERAEIVYSVVIPVYRNQESLPLVIERLEGLAGQLPGVLEAVFVVDGSPDDSARVLRERLQHSSLPSQLLIHSRNFGSFAAIRTGFFASQGRYVAAMAADLQEPPELITEFFDRLATGEWDVAIGIRESRSDPFFSRLASKLYWNLYHRLVQPEMPVGGIDIFAATRPVIDNLENLVESNSSLVGLLLWLGYRRTEVPYSRLPRQHGKSAWSTRKKVRYLLDSVFAFTSLPIEIILFIGLVGAAVALVLAFIVFLTWAFSATEVPGYTALMLVLLFSAGSIMFALGVVGTYVWRTYENTKGRPNSVVMARDRFPGE
jgi:glycosyltransferase involved in cell wall biosynthesis